DPWLEPYEAAISRRNEKILSRKEHLSPGGGSLSDFANGHLFFGDQCNADNRIFREWAPNADAIHLLGAFNNWHESGDYRFHSIGHGNWELKVPAGIINHGDLYKLKVSWPGGSGERVPAWAKRVVQDPSTAIFSAQIWDPPEPFQWQHESPPSEGNPPLIYEAHVGMATEEYKVGTYIEFKDNILPRIKKAGYNTIQLMAIQEHPYYGSFGYHVSGFFAPSSRFGTPDELRELIDRAHGMGLRVIMDLIHSHAVRNEVEGLGRYDGSPDQFFHSGPRREHVAWDSLCFDYGKDEVTHFLLSNIKYWLEEFRFDGFRFDGVTSMLYYDHGLGRDFGSYDMYFNGGEDEDAITYLGLANDLVHETAPGAITIAEEVSGYPGLGTEISDGGIGFDYRMAMGTPDYWIKLIKEKADEDWQMDQMYHELTSKRADEKTVAYAESHDQALVGDKTIIFRLMDKEMYYSMDKSSENLAVDRGIALHKMIRLITIATAGNAWLNFMGNEFGHPEWIDFPREGNGWSYHYARRQWSLSDNHDLKYHYLGDFDREMIKIISKYKVLHFSRPVERHINNGDQVMAFERSGLLFVFNFNPVKSYFGYGLASPAGKFRIILNTDNSAFGGQSRIDESLTYRTTAERSYEPNQMLQLYLPARTALVLARERIKSVHDLE
ncbi:MAG TPA: alpha amylase C-terminal domain-containing protein, partial [Bacteroidales bacterium]|nr:alpha amylase C-terminal domain-containing protein [Bacteroidales bacterium]